MPEFTFTNEERLMRLISLELSGNQSLPTCLQTEMDKGNSWEMHREKQNVSFCFSGVFPREIFGVLRC